MRSEKELAVETRRDVEKLWDAGDVFVLHLTAHSPYNGCHWEPNFLAVWPESGTYGEFVADPCAHAQIDLIHVSGPMLAPGATCHVDAKLNAEYLTETLQGVDGKYELEDSYPVDGDLHEMVNSQYWRSFGQVLQDRFEWVCSCCGKRQTGNEIEYGGYHGNGGIGVVYTDPLCPDCVHNPDNCPCCRDPDTGRDGPPCRSIRGIDIQIGFCQSCFDHLLNKYLDTGERKAERLADLNAVLTAEHFDEELEKYLVAFPEDRRPELREKAEKMQREVACELGAEFRDLVEDGLEPALAGVAYFPDQHPDTY
jgi:hypothetical protein